MTPSAPRSRPPPPWLWFWVGVVLVSLPAQAAWWRRALGSLAQIRPRADDPVPMGSLLHAATVLEAAAPLALLAGIATVFVPGVRGRRLERRFRLGPVPGAFRAGAEMAAFVRSRDSAVAVRANFLRTDQLAFAYARSFRRPAIALFGGMVTLWTTDRPAAEAVLLHEIAHHRHGDALIVGAGSFLRTLLERWLALFLAFVLVPFVAVAAWGRAVHFRELARLRELGVAVPLREALAHEAETLGQVLLPGLGLLGAGLLLWTASVVVVPLVGIWSAELFADRGAVAAAGGPAAVLHAVEALPRPASGWRWLLFRMSHPPEPLRRWVAARGHRWTGQALLLLLFPAAYLARLVLLLAWAVAVSFSPGSAGLTAPELASHVRTYLAAVAPLCGGMALLLLTWPWAVSLARRFRRDPRGREGEGGRAAAISFQAFLSSALVVAFLAAVGLAAAGGPRPPAPDATAGHTWAVPGAPVEAEWQGRWYPAEILLIDGDRYRIHYEGFDDSWDEWVGPERLRPREAPGPREVSFAHSCDRSDRSPAGAGRPSWRGGWWG